MGGGPQTWGGSIVVRGSGWGKLGFLSLGGVDTIRADCWRERNWNE